MITAKEQSDKICQAVFDNAMLDKPIQKDCIAEGLIEFAKLHIKEAVRAMVEARIPELFEDKVYLEQFVNYVLREDYPIDEKVI